MIIMLSACNDKQANEKSATSAHNEGEVNIQLTAYSPEFELFAEADPFVVGKASNILSHFTHLPDFRAVERGNITIRLTVNNKSVSQQLAEPTRKGIYSFELRPETAGTGQIIYEITNDSGSYQVLVTGIIVYDNEEEAFIAAEKSRVSTTNSVVFTKEQSWKIAFSTGLPSVEPFGQVIKTTALVQSALGDEVMVSASTNGMIMFSGAAVTEGSTVAQGQALFSISGSSLADNNIGVRILEAQNNYEKTLREYEEKGIWRRIR